MAVDTGCNRLVLREFPHCLNLSIIRLDRGKHSLGTASNKDRLMIAGAGTITSQDGLVVQEFKHCPQATANLMPSKVITIQGATVFIAFNELIGQEYMNITCHFRRDKKLIPGVLINSVFWNTKSQLFDIILRRGWNEIDYAQLLIKYSEPARAISFANFSATSSNSFISEIEPSTELDNQVRRDEDGDELESRADYSRCRELVTL